jgi:hypothetical protein
MAATVAQLKTQNVLAPEKMASLSQDFYHGKI